MTAVRHDTRYLTYQKTIDSPHPRGTSWGDTCEKFNQSGRATLNTASEMAKVYA
ncbi:hypothetical protein SAMN05216420_10910 [Nitrosospira sp. Nl5]|uniref:hypothetical protein n=1 Tax=Nitrosospira sp. Nl5 TaxID=200120 RepID=UPI000889E449|nr:hypothetical protein [Nitrosospira sp. Nl5]SCY57008.1 hypothetical protein SAMN05216420_10910 [Nitrosospira sp. Nl5]